MIVVLALFVALAFAAGALTGMWWMRRSKVPRYVPAEWTREWLARQDVTAPKTQPNS